MELDGGISVFNETTDEGQEVAEKWYECMRTDIGDGQNGRNFIVQVVEDMIPPYIERRVNVVHKN